MAFENVKQILGAGFHRAQTALLDVNGYPAGLAGALSAGGDAGLYQMLGVRNSAINVPSPRRTVVRGDQRPLRTFFFPPDDAPSWDTEVAVSDWDVAAAFEDVKARDLAAWSLHPIGAKDLTYKSGCLLLSSHAASKDSGSDGLDGWYHLLIPSVKMAYLGPGELNDINELSFKFAVTVSPASKHMWGEPVSDTNEGTTEAVMFEMSTLGPISLHTVAGNDVITSVVLDYTPLSSAVDDGHILYFLNGVETALASITPGTKTATFAALAAGAYGVVAYEHA